MKNPNPLSELHTCSTEAFQQLIEEGVVEDTYDEAQHSLLQLVKSDDLTNWGLGSLSGIEDKVRLVRGLHSCLETGRWPDFIDTIQRCGDKSIVDLYFSRVLDVHCHTYYQKATAATKLRSKYSKKQIVTKYKKFAIRLMKGSRK